MLVAARRGWVAVLGVLSACSGTAAPTAPSPTAGGGPAASAPAPSLGPLAGERIAADVARLCAPALAGRGSYQAGGVATAALLAGELAALGFEVSRQDVGGGASNVIAIKRGTGETGEAVVVSAHYDHLGVGGDGRVYLGADDNASGAAVMIAIARAIAGEPTERSVVFIAFGAEEVGLVGSGVYVRNPTVALGKTVAVINFDMVGRNFFEAGADTPDTAAVVGLDEVPGAREVGLAEASAQGLTLIEAPARLLELFRLESRTDDWWFRRNGVAAIHFSTGLHDDYHQVTDTPEKLVPSQLEKIARVALSLVRFLAKE